MPPEDEDEPGPDEFRCGGCGSVMPDSQWSGFSDYCETCN